MSGSFASALRCATPAALLLSCFGIAARATRGSDRAEPPVDPPARPLTGVRPRWLLPCASILAFAFLGCGRGEERVSAADSTVTILYPIDERGLGPGWEMPSKLLVFLPLAAENDRGELEGRLARSWNHSPDYRSWTIRLRSDVRWHDGVPVTTADIEFTLNLLSHPDVGWIDPSAFSLVVLDDTTYTISFGERSGYGMNGSPLDRYTTPYPKHLLEGLDPKQFTSWEFWTRPVGNGAFRYVRHIPQTMIELEANPDYFRGRPSIGRVVLKFGDRSIVELLSGAVDVMSIDGIDVLRLAEDQRYRVYYGLRPALPVSIVWNQHHPPFDDPRVRRALTLAIDRRTIHKALNLPEETPLFDGFVTGRQFGRGEMPGALPHDPERAKRLLEDAGWRDADGDGVRERNGVELSFTALVVPLKEEDKKAPVLVQEQLRRVGVHMEVQTFDVASGRQRVSAGEFEAAFTLCCAPASPAYLDEVEFFGSAIGYDRPRFIALLEELRTTFDPKEIDRIHAALVPMFQEDLPITMLYPQFWSTVADVRVRGLSTPHRASPVRYVEDWWLEDVDRTVRPSQDPIMDGTSKAPGEAQLGGTPRTH